jgi:hypothetical protein
MNQSPSGSSGATGTSPGSAQTDTKGGTGTRTGQDTKGSSGKQQQGQTERRDGSKQGASEREGGSKQGASETRGGSSTTAGRSGGSSSNVSLNTEQKTKIRQSVLTSSAPRVSSVDFDVRVGTVVPRSVHIVTLPPVLVEINPQWRGYRYFVYNDEIVIIEPDTLRIVAVLDV